jgi:hypothetical protein
MNTTANVTAITADTDTIIDANDANITIFVNVITDDDDAITDAAFTHVYHVGPKEGRWCWFMTVPGDCASFYVGRGYRALVSSRPQMPLFYYPEATPVATAAISLVIARGVANHTSLLKDRHL